MSAKLILRSVLFNAEKFANDESRKQWLQEKRLKQVYSNEKSQKRDPESGAIIHKQSKVRGDGQVIKIKLDDDVEGVFQLAKIKYRQTREPKQVVVDQQPPEPSPQK